ncbi:MAG TPA: mechanosensitive ion channel domain-containing protein [Acidimicrobiales bacterium]|nr:mechanosensitive ion channel domain-containing protein [Acidimicrobiales bacterium]
MPRGFRFALASGFGAFACLLVGSSVGDVHGGSLHERVIAWAGAGGFVVLGMVAVRSAANGLYRLITITGGRPGGGPARVLASLVGYLIVLLAALGMVRVPLGHLLVGGAVTGIIVGIAAQQALGNVFAGIVLLLARPFTVGLRIRVRAGALAGEFTGVVRDMSLTYVVMDTDDGRLHVPNSMMLAAAVGLAPTEGGPHPEEPLVLRQPSRHAPRLSMPVAGRTRPRQRAR